MVFFRHIMEALLNPYCLILGALAFLIIKLYSHHTLRQFFWGFLVVLLLLLIISTGWVAKSLTQALERTYPLVTLPKASIHWIVVLGGGQSNAYDKPANMILNGETIKRLIEGIRLYHQLPEARLLVSGGSYYHAITEAQHMAMVAKLLGIPESRLVLEEKSINTVDEVREIKRLLGNAPFYLVTSATHMRRSMALCLTQKLHPIAAPTDFSDYWNDERWEKTYLPNPRNLVYLTVALHEVLGIIWEKLIHDI